MSQSTDWGRIDDAGTVYVRTGDGEREVGSWQAGDPAAGLAHFCRRYDDLATEVVLLEKRLASGAAEPQAVRAKVTELRAAVPTAAAVGDLDALAVRLDAVLAAAEVRLEAQKAVRAEAKLAAVAAKEVLLAEAEQLSTSTQWKAGGDRLRSMVEDWRAIKGIDRRTDEQLWKRFAAARDEFTRRRGAHFADLDRQRGEVARRKEELVQQAEALATSTEWGPTAGRMRDLLTEWKGSGRAQREVEDTLWTRFRAAQDAFFAARTATFAARDTELAANLKAREDLVSAVEAIDVTDAAAAAATLRGLQDRFDAVGHVPRDAVRGLDTRMQNAERRVRDTAEQRRPQRVVAENPLLTQMRAAVDKAERQLGKAQATGDAGRIADAEESLAARRLWLAEAQKSAGA